MTSPEKEVGHESMKVKQKHVEEWGYSRQTLAKIIVFLFLQKQTHPLLNYFLVPCIAAFIRKSKFIFMTENVMLKKVLVH